MRALFLGEDSARFACIQNAYYLHKATVPAQRQIHVLSLLRSLHVLAVCDFKLC